MFMRHNTALHHILNPPRPSGVAFSEPELRALAVCDPPVRLPLLVGESGDEGGRLRDLLSTADLAAVSPPLVLQAREHRPSLVDVRDVFCSVLVVFVTIV